MEKAWTYTTSGNGAFVRIDTPDGRSCFLQGDDAAAFLNDADKTNDRFTDADLCRLYDDVCKADAEVVTRREP